MSYANPYAKVIGGKRAPRRGRYLQPRAAQAARTRYRASQFVPRTMGPFAQTEMKYFDTFRDDQTFPEGTDWTNTELDPLTFNTFCAPIQGTAINEREGRKIAIYRLSIRGVILSQVLPDQADGVPSPAYRFILYVDQQTNGVQSQGEDLMQAPAAADTKLVFTSHQNIANIGRFRVLRDFTLKSRDSTAATDGTGTSSQVLPEIHYKINVRFRTPLIVNFNNTNGGSVADIVDNSLHLIGCKSGAGYVTTNTYNARCYYKDK